jgi:crotonobetainyl-CoA:carnitine CoA-transferase CaiB-like acyl-CoA transferase
MFQTATGYLWIFAFQDNHWAKLCELMGRPELTRDPACIDNDRRVANRAEINRAIDNWLARLPDRDAAVTALREARIPHAPVLTVEEAMQHPHLLERRTVRSVHDRILGDFQVPGFPLRFSAFPETLELEAPFLGEHNRRILSSYLGYSDEEIERLERERVLCSAPY